METDCSEWALGCVLLQLSADGKWHPVAFDGRKLRGAELNYPVHEKELLAIKYALRTWSPYLYNGYRTEVVTDHESLKYMNTTRTPSKRLARWIDEFSEFNLNIKYRKGSEAIVPDAISRRPDLMGKGAANKAWIPAQDDQLEQDAIHLHAIESSGPSEGQQPQPLDEGWPFEEILMARINDPASPLTEEQTRMLRGIDISNFQIVDKRLYRMLDGMYIPYIAPPWRRSFIAYYHRNYGHFSTPVLDGVVKYRGWWPRMHDDMKQFTASCPQCQMAQRRTYRR